MATLGQLRAIFRRRSQDEPAEIWSDAEANSLLNQGLQRLELDILAVDPEAFVRIDTAAIVAGQAEYEKPSNMIYELGVLLLSATSGLYEGIERRDYNETVNRTGGDTIYAHLGRYLVISPTPTASVAAGIKLVHVPALVLTDDTDVPPIPQTLHTAIAMYADQYASGEVGDPKQSADLASIVNMVRLTYRKSVSTPETFRINGKG